MLKYFKKTGDRGMTFIELMVVVSIILIMSTMFVAVDPRPATNLEIAARQLANDLRRAQNMAMACETKGAGPSEYVPCGYGINYSILSTTTYIFFEDSSVTCPGNNAKDGGEEIEEISLPPGIAITNISDVNVVFNAPFGGILFGTITITLQGESGSKNIIISGDGTIEIQ